MCEDNECIGIFWMTLCIFMVVNIFSPLTSIPSDDDYLPCSGRYRKIAIMIDDRVSSCHLRNDTYYTSKTTCHIGIRLANCSWYKDIEHFLRVSPNTTKEFSDEHFANTYLTSMEEKEKKYWPHHGICVCNLQI